MIRSFVRRKLLARYVVDQQAPARGHLDELDSLRGLAALFVVFHHFVEGWTEAGPPHFVGYLKYVPFLINGTARVMLFYVLSGFVLMLPMLSGKRQDYPNFVMRRICRIYLPYVAALTLALVACSRFHGLRMYGPVFQSVWRSAPSQPLVAQHLALLGRYNVFAYNPPTWSLVHEMRISLIFPVLCLVTLRLRAWAAFLVAMAFPIAGRMIEKFGAPYTGGDPGTPTILWASTVAFCGLFLIGSLAARYRHRLVARLTAVPAAPRWAMFTVAVVLYQYTDYLHIPRPLRNFGIGLAAAYFITQSQILWGWLSRLLRLSPLRYLGRISYSLYLIHVPILMVMSIAIYGRLGYGYLLLPFLACTFAGAVAFHHAVERPAIELGKAIGRRRRVSPTFDSGSRLALGDPTG